MFEHLLIKQFFEEFAHWFSAFISWRCTCRKEEKYLSKMYSVIESLLSLTFLNHRPERVLGKLWYITHACVGILRSLPSLDPSKLVYLMSPFCNKGALGLWLFTYWKEGDWIFNIHSSYLVVPRNFLTLLTKHTTTQSDIWTLNSTVI